MFFATMLYVLIWISPGKAASLLMVDSQTGDPYAPVRMSMLKHLAAMGYKNNQNLVIKHWSLGNEEGMAKRVWHEEKNASYDVIFVNGTVAAKMFRQFAYDSPRYSFVFAAVTDPVSLGLIRDFKSPPSANFTGICYPVKIEERLRMILRVMPQARDMGFIHADMPQSASYLRWIRQVLTREEFKNIRFHIRQVPFVQSEGGHIRMTQLAKKYVKELDPVVDLFLSPNDQMGVQQPFARMVWELSSKPLVGLGRKDVMDGWGAFMSVFPDLGNMGKQAAAMAARLFKKEPIRNIMPQWPASGLAFDLEKAAKFNLVIPEELIRRASGNIIPFPPPHKKGN